MEVKKIADTILLAGKPAIEQIKDVKKVIDTSSMFILHKSEIEKIMDDIFKIAEEKNIHLPATTVTNIRTESNVMEFLDEMSNVPEIGKELTKIRELLQESLNQAKIIDSILKEANLKKN